MSSERTSELVVIGAGPAGAGSALAAAACGVEVTLLDENRRAGGQVYRAPTPGLPVGAGPDHAIGERLRRELAESPVRQAFGRRVWNVGPGLDIAAMGPDGPEVWQARHLIVATGTVERVVPFPGWTEPGVIGVGAATLLLKSQAMLPGQQTLIAGSGPLLLAAAAGILKAGGEVAGIIDCARKWDWLRRMRALAARPDLVRRGLSWLALIRRAGVPILHAHAVTRANRVGDRLTITVAALGGRRAERYFEVDALAVGHGLTPASEITRLLRLDHGFDAARGGWIAVRDAFMRSSRPDVSVAGDGAGIAGAAAALLQGRIAGLAAAHALGQLDDAALARQVRPLASTLRRAERFGQAMAALMQPPTSLIDAIPPETIVCRCEDITRAEIESAIAAGASELNQLKAWTRCGMGPCQGRICGETVADLVAHHTGGRVRAGIFTARPPLRPIALDTLTGIYDYAHISVPPAAPP